MDFFDSVIKKLETHFFTKTKKSVVSVTNNDEFQTIIQRLYIETTVYREALRLVKEEEFHGATVALTNILQELYYYYGEKMFITVQITLKRQRVLLGNTMFLNPITINSQIQRIDYLLKLKNMQNLPKRNS